MTQLRDGIDGVFVSAEVKASAEKVMALIAATATRGAGMLALTFTDELIREKVFTELKRRRPARYEIRFSLTAMPRPYLVYDRVNHRVVWRATTLAKASARFPASQATEQAAEAAVMRSESTEKENENATA